ncbi:MAG TPA: chitobiase/beta-hexosaminidase C-terminal domain-containing protein, partial [Actinomycetota bacterium]
TFDTHADTTAPSVPALAYSGFTNASVTGDVVWYRPGAAGAFTVTATSEDAESTAVGLAYPALGSGWTGTGGAYAFGATAVDPVEPLDVTATNDAGLVSTAGFTVSPDATAPVTSILCDDAACTGDWYATSPVTVALGALDAQSDVAEIRYTLDGSDPSPLAGNVYVAPFAVAATTTVRFRAYDRVGNEELVGSEQILIDTTAPTAPALAFSDLDQAVFDAASGTVFYRGGGSGGFTVTATAADAQSGVDGYSYPALGAGWTGGGGSYDFSAGAASGTHSVTATNGAGLEASTPFSVSADSTAPVTAALCDGLVCSSDWYTTAPVSVTLAATDAQAGVSGIVYSTDGFATSAPYSGAIAVAETTTVSFRATDRVGNVEATKTVTVQVDTTPPDSPSLAFTDLTNAAVTGSTVYYRGDAEGTFTILGASQDSESGIPAGDGSGGGGGGGFLFPSLGSGWTNVGGSYAFTALAVDPAEPNTIVVANGADLTTTATVTVTRDASTPVTAVTCNGSACAPWYTSAPVSVALAATDTGSGVATLRYTTDGSEPTATSPLYGGPIAVATTTTIRYRAADRVGNVSTGSTLVRVDLEAPTVALTDSPSDPSSDTSPSFAFASGDPTATFRCRLDSGELTGCASPQDYTGLAEGSHTFSVQATDPAGNVGAAAVFTWTVDTTGPAVSITDGPDDPTSTTAATFAFTSEPGATTQCRLDGGTLTACDSPKAYTGLAEGSHTFTVQATDAAGNTGAPATQTWTVDTTGPTVSISNGPDDPTNATAASFAFTTESGAATRCRLDGGAFTACDSPATYTGLAEGSHTVSVEATDAAGNTGAPSTRTWT